MIKSDKMDQYWLLGRAFTEMACFVEDGFSVEQALELQWRDERSDSIKRSLTKISQNMKQNRKFYEALKIGLPKVPDAIIKVIEQYERAGDLGAGLRYVGNYMTDIKSLSGRYIPYDSLIYSAFLGVFALIILTIMLLFVVPSYEAMYEEFTTPLPAITQDLLRITRFFSEYWGVCLILGVTLIYALRYLYTQTRIPGYLLHSISMAVRRFAYRARLRQDVRLLHTLRLFRGVQSSPEDILNLMGSLTDSGYLRYMLARASQRVSKTENLSKALAETKLFSEKVLAVTSRFDAAGVSEKLLNELARQYHGELTSGISGRVWAKPLLTLLMALLIGYIVIAMYSPLYQIGSLF